jgi:hypothetical protein
MEYYRESEPVEEDEPEESMDPSSSRSHPYKRKGKQKIIATDDSDSDVDIDEDDGGGSVVYQSRRRKKTYNKGRARGRRNSDDEEASSPVSPKRPRLRVTSPVAPRPRMVVRIRLPAKGKGKGREDSLGPQKGLFDDILGVDDRDTARTTVEFLDKQRFERSRLIAEVSSPTCNVQFMYPKPIPSSDTGKTSPSTTTSSCTGGRTHIKCKLAIPTPPIIYTSTHHHACCCVYSRNVSVTGTIHTRAIVCASGLATFSANTNHKIWGIRYTDMVRCSIS